MTLAATNRSPETLAACVEHVSHAFGQIDVLSDVSLSIRHGERVVCIGPSGSGKTTLLRVLSGHVQPSSGRVTRAVESRTISQDGALFPWLDVSENVALGTRHLSQARERVRRQREMIELVGLEGFEKLYPHQLSGGMRQRAELARALASQAELLLLDEPFSALDYQTRMYMRRELANALDQNQRALFFVTHDIHEAIELADRILVLSRRPAQVKREFCFERRRVHSVGDPETAGLAQRLLAELGLESLG
jgi:NitT/TauT family transport system ATP-binding protein